MVCLWDELTVQATVTDVSSPDAQPLDITLCPSSSVRVLFENISEKFKYEWDKIELTFQNGQEGETILFNDHLDKLLSDIPGVTFDGSKQIFLSQQQKGRNMTLSVRKPECPEVELMLGFSASPTATDSPPQPPPPPEKPRRRNTDKSYFNYWSRPHSSSMNIVPETGNYVGLVNQAMTCYLNSLLQALYMTPEFRNALYNWEFDGSNPGNSIPFQLQRLFLNLQTSSKSAVETTDLTHSFGWNMQMAWEQHDIQELCRVMFDALEQKFKDTQQANLINDLYEGKMLDYVKCLECTTEKSREDTFQDIPLPVRPFGSKVAYNSVEEALRAFVQPETLEGNNQYFCERCDKKCDAHKGLKFTKFPYLLTLHLKRFDFDYSTMNRIKLNDKVVFPEKLNLNSFIPSTASAQPVDEVMEERETVVKCDDCSTTDSGSALDDESCQGTDVSSTVIGPEDNCQDDDEGIDVSSGNTNHHENEKNRLQEPKGPYIYELFSIMIHSGSASGGHYYAYIKDFSKNQWFCFNDQTVSPVTDDDIHKTYGGGPQRGYYSGAYTSSTNAYMLMYRQIDPERNCKAYSSEEFPPHIQQLLEDMRNKEESDRLRKEQESETYKIKIYCHHPAHGQMIEEKMYIFGETALVEAIEDAYDRLKLKDYARPEDCRLVVYNKTTEMILCSLDGSESRFDEVASKQTFFTFLMEIKKPDEVFEDYRLGGVTMKVYLANLETEEVDGPKTIWVNADTTVRELKNRLTAMYKLETVHVVQETYSNQPHYLDDDDAIMKLEPRCNGYKLYVSSVLDPEYPDKPFQSSKLASIIDRFVHVIMIDVVLPDTELATLEMLSIPTLDMNQNGNNSDRMDISVGNRNSDPSSLRLSPQPVCEFFDHSNSEDSSLSDSDRTLVGDAPGDNIALLSSSSNSPADQHMASPTEPSEGACPDFMHQTLHFKTENNMIITWYEDLPPCDAECPPPNCYFKAMPPEKIDEHSDTRCCRVFIDKRSTLGRLKKHLEVILGVPVEYFKVFRHYPNQQEVEWTTLKDTLGSLKDGERITIKLGRVLKENEYSGKVYYLQPNSAEFSTFWFEWIVAKDQTVASVKREVLLQAKKQHMINIPFNKCRLRKKTTKNAAKIYLDDEKFWEDVIISNMFEMYVQEIEGPEKTSSQLVFFVRQWFPESLTLGEFHEIVIEKRTVDEVKRAISDASAIPVEFLEVAFVNAVFPCDMHILDVHSKLDWNPDTPDLESYPFNIFDDGHVFYYRDSRQQLKELSPEDRKALCNSEFKRLGRAYLGRGKSYSPKRERGLKIYVDTSPKKEEEVFFD